MKSNNKKERFLKVYVNLPLAIRSEIVYVTKDLAISRGISPEQPMSWNACWIEVKNDTEISKEILDSLDRLKII